MKEHSITRFRKLFHTTSKKKTAFWILTVLSVYLIGLGIYDSSMYQGIPVSNTIKHIESPFETSSNPNISYAAIFAAAFFSVSLIVLIITLPIYLFSTDEGRVERAGKLVKRTLTFFTVSGSALFGTLGFYYPK